MNGVGSLIVCRVGSIDLGISLDCVQEINRTVEATPVPRVEHAIRGLINLRGSLITVLDLGVLLAGQPLGNTRHSRNVIVEHRGERYGLVVDAVGDVVQAHELPTESLPAHVEPEAARFFSGLVQHGPQVLLLLDIDAVVSLRAEEAPTP